MSRAMLMVSVALASYALLSSLASLLAVVAWQCGWLSRQKWPPAIRARRLVMLRAFPVASAGIIVSLLVMPAFVMFEPVRTTEPVGPLLIGLALVGLALLGSGVATAAISALATWRVERRWLRAARPLDLDPPAGVPAYAVDSFTPIVALVGVFAPKLMAARTIIDACEQDELARIVAHERGHLRARDNLKRWLMACAPDLLRWTPAHHAIVLAWDDAAEDAADDVATAGHEKARLDLAALLVKVARLSAGPGWTAATISPFIERDRLDRRVRRLLSSTQNADAPRPAPAQALVLTAIAGVVLTTAGSPTAMKTLYEAVEAVVAFGR
ncbi:MAG: M56 family metallopeptidase [Acidobacteriota bacterium]|nr:M56 family metallopeptidase [Acidobacteriota bacterium]